jgi:hypothetical protein
MSMLMELSWRNSLFVPYRGDGINFTSA